MTDAPDFDSLAEQLAQYLRPRRFKHSQYVAETAHELAQIHAPYLANEARLAGLLHDHAKSLGNRALIAQAARFDIDITPSERESPGLLHGKVAAALLPERFNIDDPAIRRAIADHVTGRPGMGTLSRILFAADQASADRAFDGVDELRRVAREDLGRACLLVAMHKLRYTLYKERIIDPVTVEVYNELLKQGHADGR
ncbi:bis(5'-nucleosyl)-tetraphosphatase (symmetrical) YqeK [bacterium]|nr:bis(5'-nucleosyl)-tetraphosphatase (symmetrical) YqeK [bacterium]